jgi:hypothetical protein
MGFKVWSGGQPAHSGTQGVYFTVDEFKGKVPVRRKGITFVCEEGMFDNPYLSFVYEVRSGTTRSAGTRIRIDFDLRRTVR